MAMRLEMPEFFSMRDGYGHFRLAGEYTFADAVGRIDAVICWCRDNRISRLLVDIKELTGFPPPTTLQRFEFATRWADSAHGRVMVSFLARPELIDSEKIGMTMAINRGMLTEVFTEEAEAVNWIERNGQVY